MRWWKKVGPLGPLAAFAVVMPPVSGMLLLGTLHEVGPWLRDHGGAGLAIYVVGFTVLGGLALLPTYAQSMLGGWAFGVGAGAAAALVGFVGAALVSYGLARRVSGDRVERLLVEHAKWHAVYAALLRSGFWKATLIITLLRLPPNAPFAASNLAMAALAVPVGPFTLGTLAGLAPRTTAVAALGAGLSQLDLADRTQTAWFAAGLAVTVAVLAVLGWLANRALREVEAGLGVGAGAGVAAGGGAAAHAPAAGDGRPLVVFDGRCVMCARSVRFIAARDAGQRFLFAPAGSAAAQVALAPHGLDPEAPGSLVLVEHGVAWTRSTAALRIAARLDGPWSWLRVLLWVPLPVRDAAYRLVARLRYRLWPPSDACAVLPPHVRARILP